MSSYSADDLQRLEPGYLGNYGLSEAPFSSLLQDKFMFLDAERAQRINMLQHMVRYSNLLLIVQGKSGVGKTALMRRFMQTAEDDWQVCEIAANTMIDAEQLLFQAAQGFGVRELPQDASELQDMLYAKVATFHHNDQIPILIIDDAHELPKDALLAIFNLADAFVNEVNLLRIILFCEPQIEKIINSKDVRSLRERVTHTMEVPALDEDATAEYLKHRLAVAGFNGGSPFTPKIIKKIYRGSNGIPAKINTLAHEFLEQGDAHAEQAEPEIDIPQEMIMETEERKQAKPFVYIAALVLLVAMVLVFQDEINSLFDADDDIIVALVDEDAVSEHDENKTDLTEVVPADSAEPQIIKELDIKEKIISLSDDNTASKSNNETPAEGETTQTAQTELSKPVQDGTNEIAGQQSGAVIEPEQVIPPPVETEIISISPNPVPISREQQTIIINGKGFTDDSQVTISWTGKQKQLSQTQTKVISDTQIQIAITVGLDEDDWGIKVGESNAFNFKVADTQIDEGYRKDKWLLAQNPSAFTLQLFGTNKKESADLFINEHKIGGKAGYFYNKNKGRDWYSVVYGQYADQARAKSAAKTLPTSLKKIKPWVRRLDDIQASINASRKLKVASKPKAKPKPAPKKIIKTIPANAKGPADQAWLWSQDPSNFTLQLLGARQSDSVKRFLRKYNDLSGKAVYFHTRHDTRDWYTVVYGVYADRAQATKAIKRLPKELQTASPWIRSFGSIHAELDRAE